MFARGSGYEHWEDVKKNQKMHIQKWHKMGESDGAKKDDKDGDKGADKGGGGRRARSKLRSTGSD